jgi:hypothetical protein
MHDATKAPPGFEGHAIIARSPASLAASNAASMSGRPASGDSHEVGSAVVA